MFPDTYSQYEEEPAILSYFASNRTLASPRFLDIGAWSAKTFSNTRALYERGWSGVMIEPSPGPLAALIAEYGNDPRITLVSAAVSASDLNLFRITDDSVSTSSERNYEQWRDQAKFLGSLQVRGITWEQINTWFGGFQFVNIDAEGTSVDIFLAMIRTGARPECVCVEHDNRLAELLAEATRHRYRALYCNGTNVVIGL